jgi:segregation and condensation protein B
MSDLPDDPNNIEPQTDADTSAIEPVPTPVDDDSADPAAHELTDIEAVVTEEEPEPEPEPEDEKGDPYGGHSHEALKQILESALFASGSILSVNHLRDLFEPFERPHGKTIRAVMVELIASYEGRGVQLIEVASGYRFQTHVDTAQWVSRLWEEKPQRYSRALMETIALIAYRQPMTRGEIEDVRGVAVSSNIIRTLLEREWVRVVGHRDVPGRPAMYATTRQFLDYFGLKSLDQLPSLSEIRDLEDLNPQMAFEGSDEEKADDAPDAQSEITFGALIEKIRDGQATGKTGSEFIDEQLDGELAEMDDVNKRFESAMEQARAEHEHPDLELDDDDSDNDESNNEAEPKAGSQTENIEQESSSLETDSDHLALPEESNDAEPIALSEEEQWALIQEKLAQQQALLDARENDEPREENEDE